MLTRFLLIQPDGEDQHIDFSSEGIAAYVPQFKIGAFQYPFIAADISNLDVTMIDWNDPDESSYDKHNLIFDVPFEGATHRKKGDNESSGVIADSTYVKPTRPVFAVVKSWNPFDDKDKNE